MPLHREQPALRPAGTGAHLVLTAFGLQQAKVDDGTLEHGPTGADEDGANNIVGVGENFLKYPERPDPGMIIFADEDDDIFFL